MTEFLRNKHVVAWLILVSALALHVLDEAMTGFLPFYNEKVHTLRESLGFFPAPTFSFGLWLGGLTAVVILGYALIPAVNRGGRVVRRFYVALGVLMILNACGHMAGSIYYGSLLPGFWSSPLLLAAAVYVTVRGFGRAGWQVAG